MPVRDPLRSEKFLQKLGMPEHPIIQGIVRMYNLLKGWGQFLAVFLGIYSLLSMIGWALRAMQKCCCPRENPGTIWRRIALACCPVVWELWEFCNPCQRCQDRQRTDDAEVGPQRGSGEGDSSPPAPPQEGPAKDAAGVRAAPPPEETSPPTAPPKPEDARHTTEPGSPASAIARGRYGLGLPHVVPHRQHVVAEAPTESHGGTANLGESETGGAETTTDLAAGGDGPEDCNQYKGFRKRLVHELNNLQKLSYPKILPRRPESLKEELAKAQVLRGQRLSFFRPGDVAVEPEEGQPDVWGEGSATRGPGRPLPTESPPHSSPLGARRRAPPVPTSSSSAGDQSQQLAPSASSSGATQAWETLSMATPAAPGEEMELGPLPLHPNLSHRGN